MLRLRRGLSAAVLGFAAMVIASCAPSAELADSAEPGPGVAPESAAATILASNAFYYYADVEAAWRFYTDVLGFETAADYGFAKIMRVAPASYLTLVDAAEGMHTADEPKTATLAIVTDEVAGWYEYLQSRDVPMRAELGEEDPAAPHVGFVAIDPEGYFLEFERFQPHPENDRLLPMLAGIEPLYPGAGAATTRPEKGSSETPGRISPISLLCSNAKAMHPTPAIGSGRCTCQPARSA